MPTLQVARDVTAKARERIDELRRYLPIAVDWLHWLVAFSIMLQGMRGQGSRRLWLLFAIVSAVFIWQSRSRMWLAVLRLGMLITVSALVWADPTDKLSSLFRMAGLIAMAGAATPTSGPWVVDLLRTCWQTLKAFPVTSSGAKPYLAAFVLAGIPTTLLSLSGHSHIAGCDTLSVIPTVDRMLCAQTRDLSPLMRKQSMGVFYSPNGTLPYFLHRPAGAARVYSSYPAGMEVFAWPGVIVARSLGYHFVQVESYMLGEKMTASIVAGLIAALFLLLALHLVEPGPAAVGTLLLASGSVLFTVIGQALWQHSGVVFWGMLILLIEFRTAGKPGKGALALLGIAAAMLVACRLSSALFLVPYGLWVLIRSPRRAVVFACFSLLAYVPWGIMYYSVYGGVFGPSTNQLDLSSWALDMRVMTGRFIGVLFSPGRGALIYQPWLLLLGLTALTYFRHSATAPYCRSSTLPRGWRVLCVAVVSLHLLVVSLWNNWWGGHSYGSRLATEAVLFASLLCLGPIARLWSSWAGRSLLAALLIVSFFVHYPCVYRHASTWNITPIGIDESSERLWDFAHPPFLYPWQNH
jgi:hypothetical protein